MKKHIYLWLVMFLAMSLALPIYSMAQTSLNLTLQSSTGDRISTPGIKSFAIDNNNNMTIYLSQPFNFTYSYPDISVVGTTGTYSNCTVSTPASVTAVQPTAGTSLPISFQVASATSGATFIMAVPPEPVPSPSLPTSPTFTSPTFTWDIGGATPAPVGSYLAVFQASIPSTPSALTSQLVVMINITPPETVSTPTISGPSTGTVNQSYTFTASGSTSTPSGDTLQYRFDWGDSTNSGWISSTSAQHTWGSTGTYSVKAQARSATYTSVLSAWSAPSSIIISTIPAYSLTVSITPSAGGTVSVNGQPYTSSLTFSSQTIVNLSASAAQGYNFSSWSGDTTGTSSTTTITMNGPKNVTATFTQQSSNTCQPADLTSPMPWLIRTQGTWNFCFPANQTTSILIKGIGRSDDTNANFVWTFPDGRTFPDPANPATGVGWAFGQGTDSVMIRISAANSSTPNISDAYIPGGRHTLTITGTFMGYFSVSF